MPGTSESWRLLRGMLDTEEESQTGSPAVALSLLCWPSFRGHRGMIGRLLELPLWEPLAKLTYAMYLVHPSVLSVMFWARRSGRRHTH